MSRVFIHYGSKKYDTEHFTPIQNCYQRNKPIGGLWASDVNAPYGWKTWCNDNEFYPERNTEDNCFRFLLSDNAKILTLTCESDVENLPKLSEKRFSNNYPDFEKIIEQGFDVIDYRLSEDIGYFGSLYYALYGWDCDSILVLNPDVIIPIL